MFHTSNDDKQFWGPSKQNKNIPSVVGFDTETYGSKNKFVCGALYRDDGSFVVRRNKGELIEEFKHDYPRRTWHMCTNLMFDFGVMFWDTKDWAEFQITEKHGRMMWAKTNVKKSGEFTHEPLKNTRKVMFVDTLNYANISVKKLGEIIGIPKMESAFMGKIPQNEVEWADLEKYNLRDAEITQKGTKMLFNTFHELGGNIRPTIASIAITTLANKYLKNRFYTHTREQLTEEFKGYHGGRTEMFNRGIIEGNYSWIDANSMYPAVMRDFKYPDPNFLRISNENTDHFVMNYNGISNVEITCPPARYPCLPYRYDSKLLFPYGTFTGWWPNAEVRNAIKNGAVINKVLMSYYCIEDCEPFKDFVNDLYNKRMAWDEVKDPRGGVAKILLNSAYGKFGQKFDDIDELIHKDAMILSDLDMCERVGDFFVVKKSREPAAFCNAMFCSHITAYARMKIHEALVKYEGIYTDTDCVVTNKSVENSKLLGEFKIDKNVDLQYIHRSKSYAAHVVDPMRDSYWLLKSKGVPLKPGSQDINGWIRMAEGEKKDYSTWIKMRRAIRSKGIYSLNQIIMASKTLSTDDNKRQWLSDFSLKNCQQSVPLKIIGIDPQKKNSFIKDFDSV